jgi:hypothetical protein
LAALYEKKRKIQLMTIPPNEEIKKLQDYIEGFYGYGDFNSKYWFIGIEEGGDGTLLALQKRLAHWKGQPLEDLKEFSEAIGIGDWFQEDAKLQPTWRMLIRAFLYAEDEDGELATSSPSEMREKVREFQRLRLGRNKEANCLIELMPLPARSLKHWPYAAYFPSEAQFSSRDDYLGEYVEKRADFIKAKIDKYNPKTVIFYSNSPLYKKWWEDIAAVDFTLREPNKDFEVAILRPKTETQTIFIIAKHPASHGLKNAYYHEIGKYIRGDYSKSATE